MDLLIFLLVIGGLTGLTINLSKRFHRVKAKRIFIPSYILIGLTVLSGTLAVILTSEYTLLFAVGVFVFAPTGLITLVYALNYHYVNKK